MSPSTSISPDMQVTLFDSRRLDSKSLFACQLDGGKYHLRSAEFPHLSGSIDVRVSDSDSRPTSVVVTLDDSNRLVFSDITPPPFEVNKGAYLMVTYFSESGKEVYYSIQIDGTDVDSRELTDGHAYSVPFESAGSFIYQAFIKEGGPKVEAEAEGPPYSLKLEGLVHVRDDAVMLDPIVITLDPALVQIPPVVLTTGFPVTWEATGGPWYLLIKTFPVALQSTLERSKL